MTDEKKHVLLNEVYRDLLALRDSMDGAEEAEGSEESGVMDVRLQLTDDSGWALLSGDPSYDQDHRGYWGASSLKHDDTDEAVMETAKNLLEQAEEHRALNNPNDSDEEN